MVGRQQRFDPALLTGLVLGSKLVRLQSWLGPNQREGKLLLGLAQPDGAALQNNQSSQVAVSRSVLVEKEVPLEHEPALLIGGLDLALGRLVQLVAVLTFFLLKTLSEIRVTGSYSVLLKLAAAKTKSGSSSF